MRLMQIQRQTIQNDEAMIPAVLITPTEPRGAVVLVHGIGGCKEEQLGLAWRLAEMGCAAIAIDLRGHGENELPLDFDVVSDVDAAIAFASRFGPVAAVGHSMGGRLALLSCADYVFAISPALEKVYGEKTFHAVSSKRNYRVRGSMPDAGFKVVAHLPHWRRAENKETAFVFGTRDIPEIAAACRRLKDAGESVLEIPEALHGDIFLMETTIGAVLTQLKAWFSQSGVTTPSV